MAYMLTNSEHSSCFNNKVWARNRIKLNRWSSRLPASLPTVPANEFEYVQLLLNFLADDDHIPPMLCWCIPPCRSKHKEIMVRRYNMRNPKPTLLLAKTSAKGSNHSLSSMQIGPMQPSTASRLVFEPGTPEYWLLLNSDCMGSYLLWVENHESNNQAGCDCETANSRRIVSNEQTKGQIWGIAVHVG